MRKLPFYAISQLYPIDDPVAAYPFEQSCMLYFGSGIEL